MSLDEVVAYALDEPPPPTAPPADAADPYSHVEHILTKLGLSNRAQAAAWMEA